MRDSQLRGELHAMLAGISNGLDCPAIQVGGVEDHVHVLSRFGRTVAQADWVRDLKRASTTWIKTREPSLAEFAWQNGYATFSVSRSKLDVVTRYIRDQETHHGRVTFCDELCKLLRRHSIEWDERYLWD